MPLSSLHSSQFQNVRVEPFRHYSESDSTAIEFTHLGDRHHNKDNIYRRFRRQLYHASLATILAPIRPAMTTPDIVRCPDAHFRRVIWGLGPYMADYPEQALASCTVQGWCCT